jgi:hypothetical protein
MQAIRLRMLDSAALTQNQAWWDIYQDSFPDSEREPRSVLISAVELGRAIAIEAQNAATTVGIASATLLHDPPAVFLSYIASAGSMRGSGIGKRLFDYTWIAGASALEESGHTDACMICEVEKPNLATTPDDTAIRDRRFRFFLGLGGIVLSRAYFQPALLGRDPVALALIYFDRHQLGEPDGARQEALVRAIYRERYEAINKLDRTMLAELLMRTP